MISTHHIDLHIIGYDLTGKNKSCLKDDRIDFLISQKPEIQGYQGIYALFKHVVLKERVHKKLILPLDIITKDNINTNEINLY